MHKNKMRTIKRLLESLEIVTDNGAPIGSLVYLSSDPEGNNAWPWSGDMSVYSPEEAMEYWGIEADRHIIVLWP